MTDTSDLVERLRKRARSLYGATRYENDFDEAATALTAKDKEIEALRTKPPTLDAQSIPRVDALIKTLEARAETAESERDCHKQMADKNYALWAEVSRERDEARAALKDLALLARGSESDIVKHAKTLAPSIYKLAKIAARAVREQGE